MSKIRTYESNSQPKERYWDFVIRCSWCQRYELMRAIHNNRRGQYICDCVVPDVKDTNLWEQFTTLPLRLSLSVRCSWCQRYELMRAIHNIEDNIPNVEAVVPDVKDTNLWEQFTTYFGSIFWVLMLFLMSKIRTYESNSQLKKLGGSTGAVVPDVKDTNLWEQFTT